MTAILILTICIGATCRDIDPGLEPMPAMTCLIMGEQLAAELIAQHPLYSLGGWRCIVGPRKKEI